MSIEFTIESYCPADLDHVTQLFTAYASALNLDLSFQDFTTELANLPGNYSPPDGCLLVARQKISPNSSITNSSPGLLGCVCVRRLNNGSDDESKDESGSIAPIKNVSLDGIKIQNQRCCEMKRLYVSPAARGCKLGLALAQAAIDQARDMGYDAMRLDTLSSMQAARRLYASLGFREIEAYYKTPLADTIFLELDLRNPE